MKVPRSRGSNVDMARMKNWLDDFYGYRHSVAESRIDRWLNQFDREHRDLAARTLDCVDFITNEQITKAFQSVLGSLPGWSKDERHRHGNWRFVAFSVSAGESGDTMLAQFRLANGLDKKKYNHLFVHKSELLRQGLGPEDTVVFVDDFAGTGNQACNAWNENIQELLPEGPGIFLVYVAASAAARKRITEETEITVAPHIELIEPDNIFSHKCTHFTKAEKETLLSYCRKADRANPRGYGSCGFVIVFAHRCPNNSIPILHADHKAWHGLFRRHDFLQS